MHAIILGHVSGNGYLKFDELGRLARAIGVMDGIMAKSTMKEAKGPWLPYVLMRSVWGRTTVRAWGVCKSDCFLAAILP